MIEFVQGSFQILLLCFKYKMIAKFFSPICQGLSKVLIQPNPCIRCEDVVFVFTNYGLTAVGCKITDFIMHLSMLCPWEGGGGWVGHGVGICIFLNVFVKLLSLGTKSLVKNPRNPHPGANPSIVVKYSTCTLQD